MGEAPQHVTVDGERYQRDLAAEHVGPRASCDAWPLLSDGLGVHPKQIPQAMEEARRRGVAIAYTSDGRAILESRGHRKHVLKAFGYHDRDAGYGD